jgi:hypothetical protein
MNDEYSTVKLWELTHQSVDKNEILYSSLYTKTILKPSMSTQRKRVKQIIVVPALRFYFFVRCERGEKLSPVAVIILKVTSESKHFVSVREDCDGKTWTIENMRYTSQQTYLNIHPLQQLYNIVDSADYSDISFFVETFS